MEPPAPTYADTPAGILQVGMGRMGCMGSMGCTGCMGTAGVKLKRAVFYL